ncbi:MAG: alpha/beta hydrolase [Chloroflexi bacterium]|nr:MAG: alpha/beta hydrolase [Chloroflexota bacterium]TMF95298.1 MAG: alpha/beta hydrolase [Chloroflexota bacterium]
MTASQHMVQSNGLRFRVIAGGQTSGDLFVLLHGFPEGAESWSKQVDVLAGAGALAVAPDMRGYGLTDAPDRVEDYAMRHLVDDVVGLIASFGRRSAHVAGHDWGAMVAWFFAIAHPEMTKSLTVLSVGHPAALADAMEDEDQQTRSRYIDLFLMAGKAERVLGEEDGRRLRGMLGGAIPPAVVNHFVRSLERPGRLTAGLNYYRANLSPDHAWTSLRVDTPVEAPTTMLWGDHDPALGRSQAESTASHVKGGFRLEVLEGAGHWLQFERPDEVSRSLVAALSK